MWVELYPVSRTERINFCCFKTPCLWPFAMAAARGTDTQTTPDPMADRLSWLPSVPTPDRLGHPSASPAFPGRSVKSQLARRLLGNGKSD